MFMLVFSTTIVILTAIHLIALILGVIKLPYSKTSLQIYYHYTKIMQYPNTETLQFLIDHNIVLLESINDYKIFKRFIASKMLNIIKYSAIISVIIVL